MFSTQDTATRLGISASRVRRLATTYTIGTKIGPRAWVFTEVDITRLRQRPSRPKSDMAR
jgi:hypothetical protein